MPTTQGLLERAREVACQSNLRQLALASLSYAGDNSGRLPNNKEWVLYGVNSWTTLDGLTNGSIYSYIRDPRPYLCPTFYRIVRARMPSAKRSYSMNYRVALKSDTGDGPQWHVETIGSMARPAACLFISEENPPYAPWFPATVNGVKMANVAVNDGRLCWANGNETWQGATVRDAPATYHRDLSAMFAAFDGHTSRFVMDEKFQWKHNMEPSAQ